jgi:DNA-binding CsgD family transcriptional regulator
LSTAIVARQNELAEVDAFLALAGERPAGLLIAGEAGIGKTTIWRAGIAAARERSFTVLEASPAETETKLSFSGLSDLLEPYIADVLPALPAPQRAAIEATLLVGDAEGRGPDERAIATGFLNAVRALARQGPVLVAIDDVQWLDAPSAGVVGYAARRMRAEPVSLLLSERSSERRPAPLGLDRALGPERFARLTIGPMSMGAVHRLIHERLDVAFSRPALRRIHELSGGNPFFAVELARARMLSPEERLPESLDTLVRDRLTALSAQTQTALAAAAALAQPTVELVGALVAGADEALAPAERAHVVELDGTGIRFTHPLLVSGAYSGIEPSERRRIHARLAEVVDDPEERARHLAEATTGPDESIASALELAAARARARGAPATAAALLGRAAELTPRELSTEKRRRLGDAAYHHFESGDSPRARELLDGLVAEAQPGPERARLLTRLARVLAYDNDLRAPIELNAQALAEAGDDELIRAVAHVGVAEALFRLRERLGESVEHARAAVVHARAIRSEALAGEALGVQLLAEATLGREAAAATLDETWACQPASDGDRLLRQPKFHCAVAWMWQERVEETRRALSELIERGRETGDEASLPYILVIRAQADCLAGEFGTARSDAEEGYELAEQADQLSLQAYLLAIRALADAHAGNVEEARDAGERALELAEGMSARPAHMFATTALGLLDLSVGQPEATVAGLVPLLDFVRSERICDPGITRFSLDLVEALVELTRFDEAAEVLDWYEHNCVRLDRRGALASSRRCRGLLAAARGELDEALDTLEHAVAQHEESLLPFDRARTLLALGVAQRRSKQKAPARSTLEAALREFERLGASVWAERTRAEAARVSGRAPAKGGLTPSERRVAELVAEGRSNKEVAAALFVAPKTVDVTLSRIYAKFGVHSRTELAHLLAERESGAKL